MDETRYEIVNEEQTDGSDVDCERKYNQCLIDPGIARFGCYKGALACAIATGMTGGTFGAVACGVGFVAVCGPEVLVAYTAGNCTTWYDECN